MKAVLLVVVAACGGASAEKPADSGHHAAAELAPLCRAHYARLTTCETEYLNAELDLRIELNMPPDTRELVASTGRDAVLAIARDQWRTTFSTPEKVAEVCSAIVHVPADQVDRLVAQANHCAAMADCAGFGTCSAEDERSYIASGATH